MSKEIAVKFTNDEMNGLISHFMESIQIKEDKYQKMKHLADGIEDKYNQMFVECADSELASKIFFERILKKLTDAQHKTV